MQGVSGAGLSRFKHIGHKPQVAWQDMHAIGRLAADHGDLDAAVKDRLSDSELGRWLDGGERDGAGGEVSGELPWLSRKA